MCSHASVQGVGAKQIVYRPDVRDDRTAQVRAALLIIVLPHADEVVFQQIRIVQEQVSLGQALREALAKKRQRQVQGRVALVDVVLKIGVDGLEAQVNLGRHAQHEHGGLEFAKTKPLLKASKTQGDSLP